jgi:ribA/ribD-fused uncharacterized protein
MKIDRFTGKYHDLSNFGETPFQWTGRDGVERYVATSEHVYQAEKLRSDEDSMDTLLAATPGRAKRLGRQHRMAPEMVADEGRINLMRRVLEAKFRPGMPWTDLLLGTGEAELIEGNTWGDRFWGQMNGQGQNWLGKLLMERRTALREEK